jgi:hypothetical protein
MKLSTEGFCPTCEKYNNNEQVFEHVSIKVSGNNTLSNKSVEIPFAVRENLSLIMAHAVKAEVEKFVVELEGK